MYIWRNETFPVFLITVFPKNEKENLSMAERNALRKRADSIFETYGGSMKTQFEQMMDGLNDVEAFLAGEQEGFKAHVPKDVDVKAIRNRLGMTQARFSDMFGFSLDAIKHWEGGRRTPEAPARTSAYRDRQESRRRAQRPGSGCVCCAVGSSKPATVHAKVDRKRRVSRGVTGRLILPVGKGQ